MGKRIITEKHAVIYGKRVVRGAPTACWEWPSHRDPLGYGMVTFWCPTAKNTRYVLAHRVSYFIAHGGLPEGLDIMHLCHNKACTNPAHLRAGTRVENLRTTIDDGRWPRRIPLVDIPEITARHAAGETLKQIAHDYGCCYQVIGYAIKKYGKPSGDLRKRRIAPTAYPTIFARRKRGDTFAAIAASYGVNEAGIRGIFRRHHP